MCSTPLERYISGSGIALGSTAVAGGGSAVTGAPSRSLPEGAVTCTFVRSRADRAARTAAGKSDGSQNRAAKSASSFERSIAPASSSVTAPKVESRCSQRPLGSPVGPLQSPRKEGPLLDTAGRPAVRAGIRGPELGASEGAAAAAGVAGSAAAGISSSSSPLSHGLQSKTPPSPPPLPLALVTKVPKEAKGGGAVVAVARAGGRACVNAPKLRIDCNGTCERVVRKTGASVLSCDRWAINVARCTSLRASSAAVLASSSMASTALSDAASASAAALAASSTASILLRMMASAQPIWRHASSSRS